jgi:hypothetical protein
MGRCPQMQIVLSSSPGKWRARAWYADRIFIASNSVTHSGLTWTPDDCADEGGNKDAPRSEVRGSGTRRENEGAYHG